MAVMLPRGSILAVLVALAGIHAGPFAAPEDGPSRARASEPGERVIAAGDTLSIQVYEHEDLCREIIVPAHGRFTFPPLGSLSVLGRTPSWLEGEIGRGLEREGYIKNPHVAVVVSAFRARKVYVLDGVRHPQDYELPEGSELRLTQVLAMAGGFLPNADRRSITLIRRHDDGRRELIHVNGEDILLRGQIEKDLLVQDDDTIIVGIDDEEEGTVYVAGRVQKPGSYPFRLVDGCTALRAVVLAGGFAKYADEATVIVIRKDARRGKTRHIKVNLGEVLAGKPDLDLPLESGDIVVVPESFF